jgi:hypothetical protein
MKCIAVAPWAGGRATAAPTTPTAYPTPHADFCDWRARVRARAFVVHQGGSGGDEQHDLRQQLRPPARTSRQRVAPSAMTPHTHRRSSCRRFLTCTCVPRCTHTSHSARYPRHVHLHHTLFPAPAAAAAAPSRPSGALRHDLCACVGGRRARCGRGTWRDAARCSCPRAAAARGQTTLHREGQRSGARERRRAQVRQSSTAYPPRTGNVLLACVNRCGNRPVCAVGLPAKNDTTAK